MLINFGKKMPPRRRAGNEKRNRTFLHVEHLETREVPAAYVWNGPTDGLWSVADNWMVGSSKATQAPGASDDLTFNSTGNTPSRADISEIHSLTITSGYTDEITLSANLTIDSSASLTGTFTISGAGNLNIGNNTHNASFTIDGGTFAASANTISVTVAQGSTGTLSGASHSFDTRSLTNNGVIIWSGGDLTLSNGAKVNNNNGARIEALARGLHITGGNAETVINSFGATIKADIPANGNESRILRLDAKATNLGTIEVANGEVYFEKDSSQRGTVSVSQSAHVWFTGIDATTQTHTFDSNPDGVPARITGLGTVHFWTDAYIDIEGNTELVNVETLDSAREVKGPARLTIDQGTYYWFRSNWTGGGTMQVGRSSDTTSSGKLVFEDYASPQRLKIGRNLDNYGTIIWRRQADIDLSSGATITNQRTKRDGNNNIIGGLFDIQVNQTLYNDNAGVITNYGMFRKSGGGNGTATIGPEFKTGSVPQNMEKSWTGPTQGTLRFTKPVKLEGGGTVEVAQNTAMQFDDGFILSDGTLSNAGALTVSGDFAMSAGVFTAYSISTPNPTIEITGNYSQTGGTATLNATSMIVGNDVTIGGGKYSVQFLSSLTANTITIGAGATLAAVDGNTINANTFTNNGILDLRVTSTPYLAILNIYDYSGGSNASFAQSATGDIYLGIPSQNTSSILDVHGSAAFAGDAFVYSVNGFTPFPNPSQQYHVINADHLSGSVNWDFSNAAPYMGHWHYESGGSPGDQYFYIYVGYN